MSPSEKTAAETKKKNVGARSQFDYPVQGHIALAKSLWILLILTVVPKSAGSGRILKNEAAQMEFSVLFYTFQKLIKKDTRRLLHPSLVKGFTLFGNSQFPWGAEEVYHLGKDDVYLAGTAEVPVTAYFADEVLNEKDLPKGLLHFHRVSKRSGELRKGYERGLPCAPI